jgi:hypothetical protein
MKSSVVRQAACAVIFGCLNMSCVSSWDKGIKDSESISEDSAYYERYTSATRGGDLIVKFEVKYRIHATYLSPEFRTSLLKRANELYLDDAGDAFKEASSKASFIVTAYGQDRDSVDMLNPNHWTLLFESKEGPVKPVLVKKINDKLRWRNFFETMTPWTTDYLVVFDRVAVNPGADNLVEKPITKLTMATGEGKIMLQW